MSTSIFTIGHSNHSIDDFLRMLAANGVTAIADVRSSPYSRFNPQYNREDLKNSLASKGMRYVFLGAELGARSDDPSCYVDGKVQYDRLAESPAFSFGIGRVMEGSRTHRVALMCAEKDPLDCHRTILVSRELVEKHVEVTHILSDGNKETHAQSMIRLLGSLKISSYDMYRTSEQIYEEAYRKQGSRIAYDKNKQLPSADGASSEDE
jgi:uncharacterized protein (DUF488 family)